MLKAEEKIRDKLELYERLVDRKLSKLNDSDIPEENISDVCLSIGNKSHAIGLYKLTLGECNEAVTDFRMSAEWYYKGVQETRSRRESVSGDFEGDTTLLKYLYSALLAGDEDLLTQAAELARETSIRHYHQLSTTHRYYFMQAIAATILHTGEQQDFLDEMETTLADLGGTTQTFFEALWELLSGIVNKDIEQFHTGIDQLLDWHDGKVDFENRTSAKDLVSRQSVALIALANREDMDVHVDSPYVPDCISDLF